MITKLLLYCTKSKKQLVKWEKYMCGENGKNDKFNSLNGKIIAECDFEVEEIEYEYNWEGCENINYFTNKLTRKELEKQSCLTNEELKNYLKLKPLCSVKGQIGYAIHIENLKIYDEPRSLLHYTCVKGPRNMQYVYTYYDKNEYVLISIQPQWLCKILNGEKTIEIRKKVLKEMLKND